MRRLVRSPRTHRSRARRPRAVLRFPLSEAARARLAARPGKIPRGGAPGARYRVRIAYRGYDGVLEAAISKRIGKVGCLSTGFDLRTGERTVDYDDFTRIEAESVAATIRKLGVQASVLPCEDNIAIH